MLDSARRFAPTFVLSFVSFGLGSVGLPAGAEASLRAEQIQEATAGELLIGGPDAIGGMGADELDLTLSVDTLNQASSDLTTPGLPRTPLSEHRRHVLPQN